MEEAKKIEAPVAVNKRPNWLKRKLLISPHFQLRFIAFAAVTAIVACASFYFASSYLFGTIIEQSVALGIRPSNPVYLLLYRLDSTLATIFGFVSAGVVVVTGIGGLLFSHRVAGPMYRMRTHFEQVAKGETYEGLRFRTGDYFSDVADAYNSQMEHVRAKLEGASIDIKRPEEFKKAS